VIQRQLCAQYPALISFAMRMQYEEYWAKHPINQDPAKPYLGVSARSSLSCSFRKGICRCAHTLNFLEYIHDYRVSTSVDSVKCGPCLNLERNRTGGLQRMLLMFCCSCCRNCYVFAGLEESDARTDSLEDLPHASHAQHSKSKSAFLISGQLLGGASLTSTLS
jgi:hypothetical protein